MDSPEEPFLSQEQRSPDFVTMPSVMHDNSRWFRRVLIPIWTIRLFFVITLFIIYAISLASDQSGNNPGMLNRTLSSVWRLGRPQAILFCVFFGICTVTDIAAFLLFFAEYMTAAAMVAINAAQLTIWIAMVAVQAVSVSRGATPIGLGVSFVPLTGYLVVLIYALYVWNRRRMFAKAEEYARNTKLGDPAVSEVPTPQAQQPQMNVFLSERRMSSLGTSAMMVGKKKRTNSMGPYFVLPL